MIERIPSTVWLSRGRTSTGMSYVIYHTEQIHNGKISMNTTQHIKPLPVGKRPSAVSDEVKGMLHVS